MTGQRDIIVKQALDLAPSSREEFIQRACKGDSILLDEVRRVIAAGAPSTTHAATIVDGLPANTLDGPRSTPVSALHQSLYSGSREGPGSHIGPYLLIEALGEGGFGTVFLAEQERPVKRRVALKVIKLGMDTQQVVARFEQERQALAVMDHPCIARVYDAGATDAGRPYFVMELVSGDSIVSYCDQHNITIEQRLQLFIELCQAIQHAHTKGIIHRDIKPSNVLVSLQDGKPHIKVIDFGIAKAVNTEAADRTLITNQRQLVGTPHYMSPEQSLGLLDIDTRTDVYSLGVLLYELLVGVTPFSDKDLRSATYDQIQRIIREVDPPRPSTRLASAHTSANAIAASRQTQIPRLSAQLRGELDWIVMKSLDKERERRYESPSALAADIARFLAGNAVLAAPPSRVYQLRKFVKRHSFGVIAGAAVAAALLIGAAGFAWQASVARDQLKRALAAETLTKERAELLEKVAAFQASMLSDIDTSLAGERMIADINKRFADAVETKDPAIAAAARAELNKSLELISATDTATTLIDDTILTPAVAAVDKQFGDQPLIAAKLKIALTTLYQSLGLHAKALPLAQSAVNIRQELLGNDHIETLDALDELANNYLAIGELNKSEEILTQIYHTRSRVQGEDHPKTLIAMSNLGNSYRTQNKLSDAETVLTDVLERNMRVVGPEERQTLVAKNILGFVYISQGKINKTLPLWKECYEIGMRKFGPTDKDTIVWTNNYAGVLQAQGKYTEAEPLFREIVETSRKLKGETHTQTIQITNMLCTNLARQSRFAEAAEIYSESCKKATAALGPLHPTTLKAKTGYGDLLSIMARHSEAEPLLREALAAYTDKLGPSHPDTTSVATSLAQLLFNTQRTDEAISLQKEILAARTEKFGPDHPDTLIVKNNLSNSYMSKKMMDEAEALLKEVIEARIRVSGPENFETLIAQSNMSRLLNTREKYAEAEALARDVLTKMEKVMQPLSVARLNHIATLANIISKSGRPKEAISYYRTTLDGFIEVYGKQGTYVVICTLHLARTQAAAGEYAPARDSLEFVIANSTTPQTAPRLKDALTEMVSLYESWDTASRAADHDVKLNQYKAQLASLNAR